MRINLVIDYTALPDERINEMIAERVMKWHKQEDGICWITYDDRYTGKLYDKVQDDELGNLEVNHWNPVYDLNQCYQAEEEIINNFDRTENMPGAICEWKMVKIKSPEMHEALLRRINALMEAKPGSDEEFELKNIS